MKRIFTLLVFLIMFGFSQAQTFLSPGDIAFTSFETGNDWRFSFVCLVDIEPGTFISFSDAEYNTQGTTAGGSGICKKNNDPRDETPTNEGVITWYYNGFETLPAGTVIVIESAKGRTGVSSYIPGFTQYTYPTDLQIDTWGSFALDGFARNGSGGDQLFAFQGPMFNHTSLASIGNIGFAATCSCNADASCQPASLQEYPALDANALNFNALNTTPAANAYYVGPRTGTWEELQAALNDPANWVATGGAVDITQLPWFLEGNILPVSFKQELVGVMRGEDAYLVWETAFEQNARSFVIERGLTPNSLSRVGEVPARNLQSGARYSFRDARAPKGKLFYRVTAVDFDQTVTYSNIAIVINKPGIQISFYPNPAQDVLTVLLPANLGAGTLSVYSLDGRRQQQVQVQAEVYRQDLNLKGLPAGMYIVEYQGTSYSVREKFIKQ